MSVQERPESNYKWISSRESLSSNRSSGGDVGGADDANGDCLPISLAPTAIGVVPDYQNVLDSSELPGSSSEKLDSDPMKREIAHPTSNMDTMMHILKTNVGTGILAIPDGLKNSGLTVGTVGLVFIAIICIHCMHMVLKCSHALCRRNGFPSLDFASTTEVAFSTGPQKIRKFSKLFRFLTNMFLCITQLGFCCVYIVFVANNIKEIVEDEHGRQLDYRIYASMLLLPLIFINLLRNLKYLAPASIVANILQIISIGIILYYLCSDIPPVDSRKQFASWSQLPLWFGTVIYSFEGIGLVLPLENNMKNPKDFGGWTGVLNTSMVIVTCLYIGIGFFGYLKYGDDVLGSITLNLPNEIPAEIVRASYSAAIFLSYAIQFYVPIQIMWPTIAAKVPQQHQLPAEIGFRIVLIIGTFLLAILIPQLNLFISLVGAFSGSYLSIIIPPILELVVFWNHGIKWYTIVKDILIFIFGILGFVTGTYVSIYQIITTFGDT